MPHSFRRSWRASWLLAALLPLAACSSWRTWQAAEPPWTAATFERAEGARLRMADGSTVELADPALVEHGSEARLAGRVAGSPTTSAPIEVDLNQVAGLEVRKLDGDRMVGNVFAGGALVVAIVLVTIVAVVALSGGSFLVGPI